MARLPHAPLLSGKYDRGRVPPAPPSVGGGGPSGRGQTGGGATRRGRGSFGRPLLGEASRGRVSAAGALCHWRGLSRGAGPYWATGRGRGQAVAGGGGGGELAVTPAMAAVAAPGTWARARLGVSAGGRVGSEGTGPARAAPLTAPRPEPRTPAPCPAVVLRGAGPAVLTFARIGSCSAPVPGEPRPCWDRRGGAAGASRGGGRGAQGRPGDGPGGHRVKLSLGPPRPWCIGWDRRVHVGKVSWARYTRAGGAGAAG